MYQDIRIAILALCLATTVDVLCAQDRSEPLQPVIAEASAEGTEAIGGFKKPEGWAVEMVAAEPDVANIVAFDIDGKGRFWICETFRQDVAVTDNRAHDEKWLKADLASMTVQDRIDFHKKLLGDAVIPYGQHDDRIRMLEDTNGDGKLDQSIIYADHFNSIEEGTGAGVLARGDDVYFTCIPKLWKLRDSTGDGKADRRVPLADGFGVRVAFRGHDMHGLIRGPDGRLYFSIGDRGYNVQTREGNHLFDPASGAIFRCELDGSNLEVFATGLRNPQELAFDEFGNLFTGDNNSDSGDMARWVYIVEGGDTGWRMSYQYFPNRGPFNREKIWHPFHQEQPAYIVPPITNISDGPSGLTYYPGTGLGEEWKGRFLLADFRGTPSESGIRTFRVKQKGAFFELVDDEQPIWSILGTDVAFGPDGGIYVTDWVDGWVGIGKGRIYKFSDPRFAEDAIVNEVKQLLAGNWSEVPTKRLIELLGHADQRVRLEAQWELADRGEADALREVFQTASLSSVNRLHAVWGLGQIARQKGLTKDQTAAVEPLVYDGDPYLRAAGAELLSNLTGYTASDRLRETLDDRNDRVKYFGAMALARLADTQSFDKFIRLLNDNNNEDPILRHAGIMGLAKTGSSEQIAELKDHANTSVRRAAAVALRRHESALAVEFLKDRDPLVVIEAARAINDQPIVDAMPALAELIEDVSNDENLVRRVLNANFRLGTEKNLRSVAAFAANRRADESMRLEALEMLDQWKNPDERDRVMNLWRPIAPRPDADVADALKPVLVSLLSASEPIANRAVQLAAKLGMKEIVPQLTEQVNDTSLEVSTRAEALRGLGSLDPKFAEGIATTALTENAAEMRIAAIEVLAKVKANNITRVIRDAIASKQPAERQIAWDLCSKLPEQEARPIIEEGIRDYINGSLSPDVWLNVIEASKDRLNESLARNLKDAEEKWAQSDPLSKYRTSLEGGNVEAGSKLFYEKTELSCVRCHRVHRQGGNVGPLLTTIGAQRDRRYLLEAIVAPNATIAKGFETAVIADDFGDVHTGIIRDETDETVRLMQADGTEVSIFKDEIVARRRGKSAMPEDLIKQMTARDMRDLVAYLESLKIDPRTVEPDAE